MPLQLREASVGTEAWTRSPDLGRANNPIQAGRQLQVNKVLEGTVQRSGDRIRVTLQLMRVSDGMSLWAKTYDEEFRGTFSLEDTICEKVLRTLVSKLRKQEST